MKIKAEKRKNFTVTVPIELMPEIKRRAAEENRSLSSYFGWLLKTDVKTLKENVESGDIIK